MATKKKTSTVDPYITQAQALAAVRFQPQIDNLAALLKQAQATREQGIAASKVGAQATSDAIKRARPILERVYATDPAAAPAPAITVPGGANGLSDAIRQSLGAEQQSASNAFGAARDLALGELASRLVQANQGAQYGAEQAQSGYEATLGKIADERASLASQIGTYTSSEADTLANQAAGRAVTTRGQDISAETTRRGQDLTRQNTLDTIQAANDRNAASIRARTKGLLPGGVKLQSGTAHGRLEDGISAAQAVAQDLKGQTNADGSPVYSRAALAKLLLTGRSKTTVVVPGPNGTQQKVPLPAVPKIPQLTASIALDLAFDGHVSNANRKKLNARGYSLGKLGFPTAGQAKRAARSSVSPTSAAAYSTPLGQLLNVLQNIR